MDRPGESPLVLRCGISGCACGIEEFNRGVSEAVVGFSLPNTARQVQDTGEQNMALIPTTLPPELSDDDPPNWLPRSPLKA